MSPIDDSYDPAPQVPTRQPYFQDEEPRYFQQQPQQQFFQQPSFQQPEKGFLAQIDKVTWLIIGLLVLIAFFMGKTMQPVILKA